MKKSLDVLKTSNVQNEKPMATYSNIRVRFNTDQAASYLNRTTGAIRNLVMRRKIPFRKVAGRLIFFKDEIDLWEDRSPGITLENLLGSS